MYAAIAVQKKKKKKVKNKFGIHLTAVVKNMIHSLLQFIPSKLKVLMTQPNSFIGRVWCIRTFKTKLVSSHILRFENDIANNKICYKMRTS